MAVDETWRIDLERWLEPFLTGLSHPARGRMCPHYIAGLIGPGDRKSVQPIAARAGEVGTINSIILSPRVSSSRIWSLDRYCRPLTAS